ncbi:MAG: pentapeptide repeat-containing protein [Rhizonema sp. PD37]|nr:pentapeptide repeat-containing protein [Rhizonema sp. PD37]
MALDYSGQNLRGRSFRGQNLEGANFSGADIRGTDFTGANLRGANFTGAKAGLQKHWVVILLSLLIFLAIVTGFAAVFTGIVFGNSLQTGSNDFSAFLIALLGLLIFCIVFIREDVTKAFGVFVIVFAISGLLSVALFKSETWVHSGALAGSVVFTLASVGAASITGTFLLGIAILLWERIAFICILIAAVCGVLAGSYCAVLVIPQVKYFPFVWLWVAAMGVATSILSTHISWQTIVGNNTYFLIRRIVIAFASKGGTSFRNTNLTDANFTQATLKNTDLTKANLTRTCWHTAKKLDFANASKTYLERLIVRQLLVTGEGIDKNLGSLNLRGVNLYGAKLVDASFIGADLSEANLQDADLSRAKLVKVQLDGTDFTGATLTGAYIQDWGITTDTKFHGVRCEHIYMRLPTKENPDPLRKPDNNKEVFADGEFGDFIQPIFDTLDLYHNSDVEPRAIAISFKQLAENHPEAELRIVGMEVKGEDKFLLRTKTAPTADKSELSAEYFTIYNELKALAEQEIKALISEKDDQIHRLENMIMTALERPSFYAQTYNNQGDTTVSDERNINMGNGNYNEQIEGDYVQGNSYGKRKQSNFNLQGAQFAGGLVDAETVTAHQIGGNITNNAQAARTETNNSALKTILILASNPRTTPALRLDEEVREIDAGLQRAKKRELFDLKQRWAVRVQDLYQSLLDFKPQIVHFSGHGSGDDGLMLEDEAGSVRLVETVALAGLFELFASQIECVVLNACYSEVQAIAIAQHIPYVIGMKKDIGDQAAIKFATGFYSAIASGESVEFAYKLGCSLIQLVGIEEHLTPVLKKK